MQSDTEMRRVISTWIHDRIQWVKQEISENETTTNDTEHGFYLQGRYDALITLYFDIRDKNHNEIVEMINEYRNEKDHL